MQTTDVIDETLTSLEHFLNPLGENFPHQLSHLEECLNGIVLHFASNNGRVVIEIV